VPRSCAFCGSRAASKEHVWPEWISRLFPTNGQFTMEFIRGGKAEGGHVSHELDVQVRAVCAACNNGWMSRLEERAKPVLLPMITQRLRSTLSPQDQAVVAAWITKMAFLLPYTDSNVLTPYTQHERAQFGQNQLPLPKSHVWLVGNAGVTDRVTSHSKYSNASLASKGNAPIARNVVTITIGNLACQLLALANAAAALPWVTAPDIDWVPLTTAVWPCVGPVSWPPPFGLRADLLEPFANRWDPLLI
jgi:hypothetical protein